MTAERLTDDQLTRLAAANRNTIDIAWRRMRTAQKTAFGKADWRSVIRRWAEFERFCTEFGWPDWWTEMERRAMDARLTIAREEEV